MNIMETTIRFQSETRPEYLRWLEIVGKSERRLKSIFVEDLISTLKATAGDVFAGAVRVEGYVPPTFWWKYQDDWWICYTVTDARKYWFFRKRTILVIKIEQSEFLPGDPYRSV